MMETGELVTKELSFPSSTQVLSVISDNPCVYRVAFKVSDMALPFVL